MNNMNEKRSTPRIREKLALKIKEGDYAAVVETKNISASGVYCTTSKPMPLMSRVMITLLLPTNTGRNSKVEFGGIVVRVAPITIRQEETVYETAIFFDEISERAKHEILRYVKKVLSKAS